MPSHNRLILVGNLTREPELKYTPGNVAFCKGGIAVNEKWTGQDGQAHEDVMFLDFTIWKKQAETFNQYMSKGKPVLLEGRLKFEQWASQDGGKRSKHTMTVDRFVFLGQPDGERKTDPAGTAPADEDVPF